MPKKKITFSSCRKNFTTDQDKALSPDETVKNFFERAEALDFDLVGEVKRIDTGRLDIPVYFSVCGLDAANTIGTKKQMGKGASAAQAKASACMELAERFSFFSFQKNPANFITGSYRDMKIQGYPVLDVTYLLRSVHDTELPEEKLEQLLDTLSMRWCWATNITRDEQVLLPFSWFYAINEFNGPSAGNTLEEAAIQGISEVVERHVCSLVSSEKRSTPEILQTSLQDPVARKLCEIFAENGIELQLFDFSLNTGISTVAALAWDPKTFPHTSEIVYTAGTTPSPEKAVIRAITEVAQLAGDFNTSSNYEASGLPKPDQLRDLAYLTSSSEKIPVAEMKNLSDDDMHKEIQNFIDALRHIDLDIFMVDVTHEGLNIPALYTIIPGAHFRERASVKSAALFAAKLTAEQTTNPELLEKQLQHMAAIVPEAYFISFYRGKNLFECGLNEEALQHFQKALTLSPEQEDLASIHSYYGNALCGLERYDEAVEILQEGRQTDAKRPDIHNLLGVCYFKKEMYREAITCFEQAVALDPSSAMDYANLGVNYAKLAQNNEAIQFFTLALTLDPTLDFARNYLDQLLATT